MSEESETQGEKNAPQQSSAKTIHAPVETRTPATPFWISLYNHNPFYIISTFLMLYSVRLAYGEMDIGQINCWKVMGVLGGYTLVLAGIGIAIVRYGKVWDDARSVLLLLLLLFLAVSVSMDELLVKAASKSAGVMLVVSGFIFATVITQVVLRLTGILLPWAYRGPYYVILGTFFAAPYWYSPEMYLRSMESQQWQLLIFGLIAGLALLTLLPAVHRGKDLVTPNGTPWTWPYYPWSIFVMLTIALMIRSYALCLSFGPSGPIWVELSGNQLAIAYSTIWQPWFLLPLFAAMMVLLLEAFRRSSRTHLHGEFVVFMPLLVWSSIPYDRSAVTEDFLNEVTRTIGSPLWWSCWIVVLLAVYAWWRNYKIAKVMLGLCVIPFFYVTPSSVDLQTLGQFQAWPLLIYVVGSLYWGVLSGSSFLQTTSILSLAIFGWNYQHLMPVPHAHYWLVCLATVSLLIISLIWQDNWADFLKGILALGLFILAVRIVVEMPFEPLTIWGDGLGALGLGICLLIVGALWKSQAYWISGLGSSGVGVISFIIRVYGMVSGYYGEMTTAAFLGSLIVLILGLAISAHKANWIPNIFVSTLQKRVSTNA